MRRAADLWRRPAARLRLGRLHLEGEPSGRAASGDAHPDRARPTDLVLRGPSVARKECHVIRSATRNRHPEPEIPVKERCDLRGPGAPLAKELAPNRPPFDYGTTLAPGPNPALTATPIRPDGAVLQQPHSRRIPRSRPTGGRRGRPRYPAGPAAAARPARVPAAACERSHLDRPADRRGLGADATENRRRLATELRLAA
jgi:hypothetical protein